MTKNSIMRNQSSHGCPCATSTDLATRLSVSRQVLTSAIQFDPTSPKPQFYKEPGCIPPRGAMYSIKEVIIWWRKNHAGK
jgi:hypothetical protein